MDLFYRFGKGIYQLRWLIVVVWVLMILAVTPYTRELIKPFKKIGFEDPQSESAQASKLLNKNLGYSYNRFIVMYTTEKSFKDHPEYLQEIKDSLNNLKKFPIKHQIIYPDENNLQISKDKHAAYAIVLFSNSKDLEPPQIDKFKSLVKTTQHLDVKIGGEPIFLEDTKTQTQHDLFETEYISAPISLITMILVFGSVMAGILPIFLGAITVFLILASLFIVSRFFDLSVFTINIALLVGLCLSLDYALLIISRFRDEIKKGIHIKIALAKTQTTAGKAVFFSALAVFISLSALLLFPVNILYSVGIGGLVAVLVASVTSLILLPALLGILSHRINWLRIRAVNHWGEHRSFWHWSVRHVEKRPWFFFITILILLLALGYPFLSAKISISDFRILPKGLESREIFEIFKSKFGENQLEPIFLIVQSKQNDILTKKNIGDLYELSNRLKQDTRVKQVTSIVNTKPRLSKEQYQNLYTQGKRTWTTDLKDYIAMTTVNNFTVMTLTSRTEASSPDTKNLIKKIRAMYPGKNFKLQITGASVNEIDVKSTIMRVFPYAFLWIIGFTYLILLILLRSVVLPLKAIFTTILSLCASYGVLVLVFQEGYLHRLLNFDPQGMIDITLLIIIFCALFGISMDYEVFLLARIKEYYEKTHNTAESIVLGIARSSKIISSAAIIIILLCFAFMAADVIIVKAFGLGMAVAVFVDAFIIRILFVPAIMQILGKWNWYAPRWLKKILPHFNFDAD